MALKFWSFTAYFGVGDEVRVGVGNTKGSEESWIIFSVRIFFKNESRNNKE